MTSRTIRAPETGGCFLDVCFGRVFTATITAQGAIRAEIFTGEVVFLSVDAADDFKTGRAFKSTFFTDSYAAITTFFLRTRHTESSKTFSTDLEAILATDMA